MDININNVVGDYSTFKGDPEFLLSLINKYVKVDVLKNVIYAGYVLAIDPEQYSIVLMVLHGDSYSRVLIPGHAISNVTESTPSSDIKPWLNTSHINTEDVSRRKLMIISWFRKNLLPVSESSDNIILGNAIILPPYGPMDICTDNLMVANQIRDIIMKMPDDYGPL
ncbi:uncharacterized protein LOC119832661 [Zerene cesonia]|uniref:uncharacterized protein LOC119832620 n=1 Tax=Zerene cesonia TaxID=33412 RepID=UPI0018E58A5C|nr:uncharacterized protein LOC119832620 [Zerene cesonia]XP_038212292.1 uncharacterized protein LOC119832661 [Zerene cesonia]